ncbi:hypothetical protein [Kribbella deserti]|uniref:Uncharacterized protein n=1 Tax=Kribbella deserti TaxID=1926257 RepID=A0ABV6QJ02_9ACTN
MSETGLDAEAAELLRRRQMAQQQLADAAARVGRVIQRVAGYEETFLHQNDRVQQLIRGTEPGTDHTIARHLGDASGAVRQAIATLQAAESMCRSASQA